MEAPLGVRLGTAMVREAELLTANSDATNHDSIGTPKSKVVGWIAMV
jgi:hypothetical protein